MRNLASYLTIKYLVSFGNYIFILGLLEVFKRFDFSLILLLVYLISYSASFIPFQFYISGENNIFALEQSPIINILCHYLQKYKDESFTVKRIVYNFMFTFLLLMVVITLTVYMCSIFFIGIGICFELSSCVVHPL